MGEKKRVVIVGAAGRDFHNFNTYFRDNPVYEVVSFAATQIPGIAYRRYPPELSGSLYPDGVPIYAREDLRRLVKEKDIDTIVLAYSDLLHQQLINEISGSLSLGPDFLILGPDSTTLESKLPLISICAVRTGAGKSTVTRRICEILRDNSVPYVVIRHPMPYGDLTKQIWQRYETTEDMDKYDCTVEEREEYEPHIRQGNIVYAGVDYEEILRRAEKEVGEEGVIVWDGGNNDLPFYRSDLHVVVADPFRPGHELSSYPGQVNLRLADVVVINKADSAPPKGVRIVRRNTEKVNPHAKIVEASSGVDVDAPKHIESKRVLVIEDGPTLTHGGLSKGAGIVAAEEYGASEIVDPKSSAVGSIKKAYEEYPHIGPALPALGYSQQQIQELAESIRRTESDTVVMATPTDLTNLIDIDRPVVRVSFELQEASSPTLAEIVQEFLSRKLVVQDSTLP